MSLLRPRHLFRSVDGFASEMRTGVGVFRRRMRRVYLDVSMLRSMSMAASVSTAQLTTSCLSVSTDCERSGIGYVDTPHEAYEFTCVFTPRFWKKFRESKKKKIERHMSLMWPTWKRGRVKAVREPSIHPTSGLKRAGLKRTGRMRKNYPYKNITVKLQHKWAFDNET